MLVDIKQQSASGTPRRYAGKRVAMVSIFLIKYLILASYLNSNDVGSSAVTPASAARNCAVDRRIAEPIGVTDVRVQ